MDELAITVETVSTDPLVVRVSGAEISIDWTAVNLLGQTGKAALEFPGRYEAQPPDGVVVSQDPGDPRLFTITPG